MINEAFNIVLGINENHEGNYASFHEDKDLLLIKLIGKTGILILIMIII